MTKKTKQNNKNRWWISGVAAALLLSAVAVSCAPTEPATPTKPAAPTIPPTPTKSAMPANPAARANMYSKAPEMQIDSGKSYVATISTAKGDIVVQLDASAAPLTVNNFVFLARQGFYDKLTFHRVVSDFVAQGGDPTGTGTGGPGYTVPAEIQLLHIKGAIGTARQGDQFNPTRASAGSQFYIALEPLPGLDAGGYTVFGHVTEGMDVVLSIAIGDVIEKISIGVRVW